jgi:hypothetical protein
MDMAVLVDTTAVKRIMWLLIVMLGVTACNGGTAVTTTTSAPAAVMAGLSLEVHQAPG